jgi:arylsulfatase A-like enzyme
MVTSDHGQEFFEHKDKGHAKTLFDEVLLVPLIMRLPGHIEPGKRIKEQVRHLDIMSTLLPFADLPENLDGVDLSLWIQAKAAPRPLEAMSRLYRQGLYVSMRTPRFKYITYRQRRTETESLYDLQNEPSELRPVFWRQQRARSRTARESFDELKALLVREELEILRSAAGRGVRDEDAIELPDDLKERLKALGYLQ